MIEPCFKITDGSSYSLLFNFKLINRLSLEVIYFSTSDPFYIVTIFFLLVWISIQLVNQHFGGTYLKFILCFPSLSLILFWIPIRLLIDIIHYIAFLFYYKIIYTLNVNYNVDHPFYHFWVYVNSVYFTQFNKFKFESAGIYPYKLENYLIFN